MIKKLRLLIRENKFFRQTIYGPIRWVFNDVYGYRRRLLQRYGAGALKKVMDASSSSGLAVIPAFGTLLGLVRDRGFMKHDDDMDFVILPREAGDLKTFFRWLVQQGFYFEWMETINGFLTEVRFRYHEVPVDFFLHGRTADGKQLMMIQKDTSTRRYEYPMVDELVDYAVAGCVAKIPANYDEYLTSLYGSWNQVVKSGWSSTMAPCCKGETDASKYDIISTRDEAVLWKWLQGHSQFVRFEEYGHV